MRARVLRLGLFSPSPILDALERSGALAEAGLELESERVRSSPAQFGDLDAGRYDVVLTSPDNVLSYRYDDANLLGHRIDVRILAAVDRGMGLSLVARDGVAHPRQLAGQRIGVDVPESGFALALFALLRREGLAPVRDYTVIELGATPRRLDALLEGECDATLLNAGFDLRAEAAGAIRLARIAREFAPYLGTVLATTGAALAASGEVIGRFVDAWSGARARLASAAGKEEIAAFARSALGLGDDEARRFAMIAFDPEEGLVLDGRVEVSALQTLATLRRREPPSASAEDLSVSIETDADLVTAL